MFNQQEIVTRLRQMGDGVYDFAECFIDTAIVLAVIGTALACLFGYAVLLTMILSMPVSFQSGLLIALWLTFLVTVVRYVTYKVC